MHNQKSSVFYLRFENVESKHWTNSIMLAKDRRMFSFNDWLHSFPDLQGDFSNISQNYKVDKRIVKLQ